MIKSTILIDLDKSMLFFISGSLLEYTFLKAADQSVNHLLQLYSGTIPTKTRARSIT